MKTTRTYLSGCTWCGTTGFVKIPNPGFMTSALTNICPVCNGNKTIIITETMEDDCLEQIKEIKTVKLMSGEIEL